MIHRFTLAYCLNTTDHVAHLRSQKSTKSRAHSFYHCRRRLDKSRTAGGVFKGIGFGEGSVPKVLVPGREPFGPNGKRVPTKQWSCE